MASASGSIEQSEGGLRVGYGQGDTGKPDSCSHVEHPIRGLPPHAGKHQGVCEVTVNDARRFDRTKTPCLDPLRNQPPTKVSKGPPFGRTKPYFGPPRRSVQLIVEVFPVKHAN
jgi:hypothetical protein